jgi:putative DNA primase/helicase
MLHTKLESVVVPRSRASGVLPTSLPPRNTLASVVELLSSLPEWAGVLATSELDQGMVFRRPPPWVAEGATGDAQSARPAQVRDRDIDRVRRWLEERRGLVVSKHTMVDAVRMVADENAFHPVRDYLQALTWDGTPRAARWLEDFARVRPTSDAHGRLVRSVAAKWLVSCVARAMIPGCKVDTMLILEGKQGIGKSTAFETLAGRDYFCDSAIDVASKDACQVIQGVWIYELAELDALLRRDDSIVKAFLTRAVDRFRPPYARAPESIPRSVVFAGTVNHGGYLRDTTGNRRYWIVPCEEPIDIPGLAAARDQLWAEAVHLYRSGEAWHLGDEDEARMRAEQEERLEGDPWEDAITEWLANRARTSALSGGVSVTMDEVLTRALGLKTQSKNPQVTRRVNRLLAAMGFARKRRSEPPRAYVYAREAAAVPLSNCPTTRELTSRAAATNPPGRDFDLGLSSSTSTRSES